MRTEEKFKAIMEKYNPLGCNHSISRVQKIEEKYQEMLKKGLVKKPQYDVLNALDLQHRCKPFNYY